MRYVVPFCNRIIIMVDSYGKGVEEGLRVDVRFCSS